MINRLAQALERSLAALEIIAAGEVPFTVLQARMDGLPAATLSRLLKALLASGQIAGGPRGYRLTPLAQQHAEAVLVAVRAAESVAAPVQKLAQVSGESAAFYAWDNGRVLLRATQVVADSAAYAPLGSRVPELTRHGFAMACVVGFNQAQQQQAFATCPRRRETTWPQFRHFLAEAKELGVVVEPGWHRPGVCRVAALVPGFGAIGVSSPRGESAHIRRLVELVKIAADETRKLLIRR